MLRQMICGLATGMMILGFSGCDSGSGVGEGVPANVDMNKSYTPNVEMPGMSPKAAAQARKAAAAAPKTP